MYHGATALALQPVLRKLYEMSSVPKERRAYDHRLRQQVFETGALGPVHARLRIPRSTVASWKRRGSPPVVSVEAFEQDHQQLLNRLDMVERKARTLAAVVRLLLALLRVSGFRLDGERLPEGVAKASVLRAISSAKPALSLTMILRILGLPLSRYHRWQAAAKVCGLDDRSSCPRTTPSQLTADEIVSIKGMVLDPQLKHMPLRTLSLHAQRIGRVFASVTTWARLVRERGWRRLRARVYPPRPTEGVRATRPNELWHIDVTVLKLLDGTRAYLHAVIVDNYSRNAHNRQLPHSAFRGQTHDEMYFGIAANLPEELAVARKKARERRLASNRAASCDRCFELNAPVVARQKSG
jgi:hypothetical protein